MKILFAGGGTGGHLYSGIAIAEEACRGDRPVARNEDILFVGTQYGLEKEIVPKNGYRLEFIPVKPLKGRGILDRLKSLLQIPYSLWKSFLLLRKEKPDLVFGIGGYASGPVTLMAHFMGIQTAVIDQNSIPGITNRILGKFVNHVFVCFEKAKEFFNPKKVFFSGNPVRRDFLEKIVPSPRSSPARGEGEFCLLILGGSQGARSINQAMVETAKMLSSPSPQPFPSRGEGERGIKIIHQTGKADYEWVKKSYAEKGVRAEVFDFVHNIHEFYSQADLIICRSGAGTICEIEIVGKPAIYIPYPYAADDHQRFNAQEVVEKGAGKMLLNHELNAERLSLEIKNLMNHPEDLQKISQNVQKLAKPQAALEILKKCGMIT